MDGPAKMRLLLASAACALCLAGCATVDADSEPTLTKATVVPPGAADARVSPGKSTKADVMATLGKTTAITFDSGYEIWVYHIKDGARSDARPTEFVVLFDPSGIVTKTRTRPAPPSRG
jgi:outer membrane protein assembly factor BamE (lipoprotein component of BamABCDE complex)